MDPITALSAATAAFTAVKKLVETGREIEDVAGQLGKWFSAVSDLREAEREAKNPPMFKKLLHNGSVEEEALNATIARQKTLEQESQLRELIVWRYGLDVYRDMIQMRKDIRERREREIYRQKRRKKAVLEYTFATLALGATVSLVAWFITFIMKHGG
jgi:hypothetical protein